MKKVLILGVASVQMDAINLLKEMDHEVHACAMANDGPGAEAADYFSLINILDRVNIENYIKENDIDLVYSVGSDMAIPVSAGISQQMGMPRFISEETATICNNKDLMRSALTNDFYGNVPFQVLADKAEILAIPYPFIRKPTDSQGQRGVVLVKDYDEFLSGFDKTQSYSRSGKVILERYIDGPELSVNGYMVDGELKFLVHSDRDTWTNFTGLIHKHIVPTKYDSIKLAENLKRVMLTASNKLGIKNGPVYAQVKIEEDNPYIIEITPRLDGCHMWKLLTYYSGVNLLKLTFEHLLSGDVSELGKQKKSEETYILEFICQEPNTKADYVKYANQLNDSLDSFTYYQQGDNIRPVNGKFDKIGYFIYKE